MGFPGDPVNVPITVALTKPSKSIVKRQFSTAMSRVGVLGAGISGLAAAYSLQKQGMDVQILEATSRPGGVIRSEPIDQYLVEHGPNSIRAGSAPLERVIDELGLDSDRVWANSDVSTRYIVRNGRPVALPTSIGSFLSTDLFSTRAKLRLLAEPFVRRAGNDDESIASFARRRLGREILDYAVAPFVGGVFGGSPENLSLRHALPRLAHLEQDHGSLFLGAVKTAMGRSSNSEDDGPSGLFSFRHGLQQLPNALAEQIGDQITYDTSVRSLHHQGNQWEIEATSSDNTYRSFRFDAVISTVPLHEFESVELETAIDLTALADVRYPPLDVVALGFHRDAIAHSLDGFGLLVPPIEDDFNILGTIFSSTLFPARAPDENVLLTSFVGSGRNPDLTALDATELQSAVERDLDRLLGLDGEPSFCRHVHWANAIPQYRMGYGRVKETLENLERRHPALAFAGNYRQGVSVSDALESGFDAAERVLEGAPRTRS